MAYLLGYSGGYSDTGVSIATYSGFTGRSPNGLARSGRSSYGANHSGKSKVRVSQGTTHSYWVLGDPVLGVLGVTTRPRPGP